MMRLTTLFFLGLLFVELAHGETYKQLPPAGIQIDAEVAASLSKRVETLQQRIESLAGKSADSEDWRPDTEVLVRAVRLALEQNLFFKKKDPENAARLLDEASRRIDAAARGERGLRLMGLKKEASEQPQTLVGGFVSRIDDSVQPFGIVIPAGFDPEEKRSYRLDVWLHGRGDTKTEIPFLTERMSKAGQYTPSQTFVLHPFGRHCNAFKFAGETDVYEAIERAESLVAVDQQRVSIRGFSMGGAGCWHLAVHDPARWLAANPGAGFVDTIQYQGWDRSGYPFEIDEVRSKLMNWYDVLPWVDNLRNTNTIAYSGEVDKQKKAADRVYAASQDRGIDWRHVIGAGMGHRIAPESATLIEKQVAQWAENPLPLPRQQLDFTTYTLRYNRIDWCRILGLQQHWTPGRVQAKITGDNKIEMTTKGVTRLKLDFRDSGWPRRPVNARLKIDGQDVLVEDWDDAPGIQCELRREDEWRVVDVVDQSIRKRPGLQGPIDDAFCERFVFVLPSRPAKHGVVQRWIDREIQYAQDRWRRLMRGRVNVVRDSEVTEEMIDTCHLICFGDFSSNRYLANVSGGLPIQWTSEKLQVGSSTFDPSTHAAAFCFPNPGNPKRYLVVNSGMTFREFSNVSNSRQIAMLPDWAILDVSDERGDGIFAGKIAADGFFDEDWKLSTPQ